VSSLARDRTTRRITVLTDLQIKPFQAICKNVINELGSEAKATEALGVSVTVFRRLMLEGYLTDKMAHVILDKRKAMKAK
jgi:hypothetical protein